MYVDPVSLWEKTDSIKETLPKYLHTPTKVLGFTRFLFDLTYIEIT